MIYEGKEFILNIDAAKELGTNRDEVSGICKRGTRNGTIEAVKITNRWYISRESLDDLKERQKVRAEFYKAPVNSYT